VSEPAAVRPNPYIGARPFEREEPLFGRDREVRELSALLIAERIVLLYSPSGAGKTSLIQSCLLDEMEKEGFEALPIIRVSRELSPEEREPLGSAEVNRYVLSSLLSLEELLPQERKTPVADLARMKFDEYLKQRAESSGSDTSPLLIFDQFEEVLTLEPTDQKAKEEFFDQVGAALRHRERWALFAMREDYVGALEPYLRRLPTRLRTTFRLDLLDEAAALLAIREPARSMGVEFEEEAARHLVQDLRTMLVQRPDGTSEKKPGPYAEPVQLQVVCKRLWERLPADVQMIDESRIDLSGGDVDTALADYYSSEVAKIAGGDRAKERAIRTWFEERLLTEQGTRGQVLLTPGKSQGLDNTLIEALVKKAHLVRAESRRGSLWFELAHDRLIEPVKKSNAEWLERNLDEVERAALAWVHHGRSEGLLFRDSRLEEAEKWAEARAGQLTDTEREFLEACREAEKERKRRLAERENEMRRAWAEEGLALQVRQNRWIRALLFVALVFAAVAAYSSWSSHAEMRRAQKAETLAKAEQEKAVKAQQLAEQAVRGKDVAERNEQEVRTTLETAAREYLQKEEPQTETAWKIRAGTALENLSPAALAAAVGPVRILFYTSNPNASRETIEALRQRGFKPKVVDGKWEVTNAIWYGNQVAPESVRVVALALIGAGAKIQQIEPFQNSRGKERLIQIGTSQRVLFDKPCSVEKIQALQCSN
jgi:Novel STAND NTPase 1